MNIWQDVGLRFGIALVVSLVTALITRAYYRQRYKAVYEAAAKKYCKFLGRQIRKAAKVDDGKVEVQARSIVAVRDDLRKRLVTLSDLLNSEIDELQRDLTLLKENPDDLERRQAVKNTVEVLNQKWPSKSMLIETEIRKLLTELGMQKF